jgi:uncharacterized glyoxalase superfamily metalloenzyme YdcJ
MLGVGHGRRLSQERAAATATMQSEDPAMRRSGAASPSAASTVTTGQLRERFASALSTMYGDEVPAYTALVEASARVNTDYMQSHPGAARLGSLLDGDTERADRTDDSDYSHEWMAAAIDRAIHDPYDLYDAIAQETHR